MPEIIHVTFRKHRPATCGPACYDATDPQCPCICNGRNHGVGLDKAVQNNGDYQTDIVNHIYQQFPNCKAIRLTTQIVTYIKDTRYSFKQANEHH